MPKPSRSALYFFADEYRRQHGQRMSITEAIEACHAEWKALSEEEKQPYKIRFEQWRIDYRANPETVNQTSRRSAAKKAAKTERILSERDIPCEELKIHYDRFAFERDHLAFEYLPLDIEELLEMPIYLINFQIFCKVDEEDGGQYIPAEMSLLRVNSSLLVSSNDLSVFALVHFSRRSGTLFSYLSQTGQNSVGLYVGMFGTCQVHA